MATAIGPVLGGVLISAVSWRLIFLINLPLAAVVVAVAQRHVPDTRNPEATGRVDLPGAVLVTVGLVGITMAFIEAPAQGWGAPLVLGALLAGVAALGGFVVAEGRERNPMLPLAIFRSRQFSATNAVTFVVYGALGGALFLLPVQLQQVARYSPLEAGASLLPLTAVMLVLSARSGALAARIGPRLQMAVGPVVVGAGMVLLRLAGPSGNYLTGVLPGVLVLALGLAITVAPLTATALASAPTELAGVASAANNDVARTGSLVAVAVLPALAGISGHSYLHPAQFAAGFRDALVIAAAAAALGGVGAAVSIRNPPRSGDTGAAAPGGVCCPLEATSLAGAVPAARGAPRPRTSGATPRGPRGRRRRPRGATMAP